MKNLATVYEAEGKYAQYAALISHTLEIGRRVLDPEHPFTLLCMANLAGAYSNEGVGTRRPRRSTTRVLEIRRRVIGPEHPVTLRP